MKKEDLNKITSIQRRSMVIKHLYDIFEKNNKKDFFFPVKNISKSMDFSSYIVLGALLILKEQNLVIVAQKRKTRDLWRTNFEHKTKEEIENEVFHI